MKGMEEKKKSRGRDVRSMRWLGIGTVGLFTLDSICVNWLEYDFQLNPYLTQARGSHVGNYAIQTCAYYMCSVSRVFERNLGQKIKIGSKLIIWLRRNLDSISQGRRYSPIDGLELSLRSIQLNSRALFRQSMEEILPPLTIK